MQSAVAAVRFSFKSTAVLPSLQVWYSREWGLVAQRCCILRCYVLQPATKLACNMLLEFCSMVNEFALNYCIEEYKGSHSDHPLSNGWHTMGSWWTMAVPWCLDADYCKAPGRLPLARLIYYFVFLVFTPRFFLFPSCSFLLSPLSLLS